MYYLILQNIKKELVYRRFLEYVADARDSGFSMKGAPQGTALHHRFANATQVWLCRCNWYKLENMKNKLPNNTYMPLR